VKYIKHFGQEVLPSPSWDVDILGYPGEFLKQFAKYECQLTKKEFKSRSFSLEGMVWLVYDPSAVFDGRSHYLYSTRALADRHVEIAKRISRERYKDGKSSTNPDERCSWFTCEALHLRDGFPELRDPDKPQWLKLGRK